VQISDGPVGVERSYGDLVDVFRPLIVALMTEAFRKAARAEAVDEDGEITLLRPEMALFLVPTRQRRSVIPSVRQR